MNNEFKHALCAAVMAALFAAISICCYLYEYRMTNQEYNYRVAVITDAIEELEEELQAFKDELKILKETQCTQDNTQDNQ